MKIEEWKGNAKGFILTIGKISFLLLILNKEKIKLQTEMIVKKWFKGLETKNEKEK